MSTNQQQDREAKELAQHFFQEAYIHQMRGELEKAIELYKRSINYYPTSEAYTFLGWTYSFQHRYQEAIEMCRTAIQTDPSLGNPYNDIGVYYIELGKLDEAIPYLERAKRADRYEAYHYPYFNLGRIYEAQCRWIDAAREYEGALLYYPEYEPAQLALNRARAKAN